jgi:hypothetical protein
MAITEKQLSDGQEVISLLEISLLKLKRALLQKNAGEVLFVRKVPVRGTSEVQKEL